MLAIDSNGAIVLIEQFRKPRAERTLEIPGGVVREGETPEKAAHREFEEETGLKTNAADLLFTLDLDLSTTLHRTHVFISTTNDSCTASDAEFNVRRMQIHEALNLVQDGTITHAPTVAATLAVALNIGQVK